MEGSEIKKQDSVSDTEKSDEEDISTALNKEIKELKTEYAKPVDFRRFQVKFEEKTGIPFFRKVAK